MQLWTNSNDPEAYLDSVKEVMMQTAIPSTKWYGSLKMKLTGKALTVSREFHLEEATEFADTLGSSS